MNGSQAISHLTGATCARWVKMILVLTSVKLNLIFQPKQIMKDSFCVEAKCEW